MIHDDDFEGDSLQELDLPDDVDGADGFVEEYEPPEAEELVALETGDFAQQYREPLHADRDQLGFSTLKEHVRIGDFLPSDPDANMQHSFEEPVHNPLRMREILEPEADRLAVEFVDQVARNLDNIPTGVAVEIGTIDGLPKAILQNGKQIRDEQVNGMYGVTHFLNFLVERVNTHLEHRGFSDSVSISVSPDATAGRDQRSIDDPERKHIGARMFVFRSADR